MPNCDWGRPCDCSECRTFDEERKRRDREAYEKRMKPKPFCESEECKNSEQPGVTHIVVGYGDSLCEPCHTKWLAQKALEEVERKKANKEREEKVKQEEQEKIHQANLERERKKAAREKYCRKHLDPLTYKKVRIRFAIDLATKKLGWDEIMGGFAWKCFGSQTFRSHPSESAPHQQRKRDFLLTHFGAELQISKVGNHHFCCENRTKAMDFKKYLDILENFTPHK